MRRPLHKNATALHHCEEKIQVSVTVRYFCHDIDTFLERKYVLYVHAVGGTRGTFGPHFSPSNTSFSTLFHHGGPNATAGTLWLGNSTLVSFRRRIFILCSRKDANLVFFGSASNGIRRRTTCR